MHVEPADWFSSPLDHEFNLKLNMETKERGSHMKVLLYSHNKQVREKVFVLVLHMLNQQSNKEHYTRLFEATVGVDGNYSHPYLYIPFKDLHKRDANIQYLKNDCLKFVL